MSPAYHFFQVKPQVNATLFASEHHPKSHLYQSAPAVNPAQLQNLQIYLQLVLLYQNRPVKSPPAHRVLPKSLQPNLLCHLFRVRPQVNAPRIL